MEIRDDSTLPEILEEMDRRLIDRPSGVVSEALSDCDFIFKETLWNRLEARPQGRAPLGRIWAKMPSGRARVYELVTEKREIGVMFVAGFGGNIAQFSHGVYRLTSQGAGIGRIDFFPNTGFVFTNKEPCTALSFIEFEGENYVVYRADLEGPLLKSKPYAVVTSAAGELIAIVVEMGGWFIPKRGIKLYQECSDEFVALIMATYHGLVFRSG